MPIKPSSNISRSRSLRNIAAASISRTYGPMRSRAKRRTASWNIRSSSLSTVKGGGGTVEVSATFGIMPPVYSPGCIIATTGGAMKTWVLALLLISFAALWAFQAQPRCTAVDPDTAKTGDTVNATCENVNKSTVADMFLTDGKDDV